MNLKELLTRFEALVFARNNEVFLELFDRLSESKPIIQTAKGE